MKIEKLNKNRTHLVHSLESYCSCSCNCSCINNCNCNPNVPTSGPGATGYTVVDVLSDSGVGLRNSNQARAANN